MRALRCTYMLGPAQVKMIPYGTNSWAHEDHAQCSCVGELRFIVPFNVTPKMAQINVPSFIRGGGGSLRLWLSSALIHSCVKGTMSTLKNSIAFGSAPRREVDSQPISPLARPAVSQTETHSLGVLSETNSLGFLSVANAAPSSGGTVSIKASSGRTGRRLTAVFWSAVRTPVG